MSQTEKKRKFNLIDLLLLVLVIAAVLALVLRGNLARQIGLEHKGETAEVTLSLSALETSEANLFKEKNTLSDPATGEVFGVIKSVRAENALVYTLNDRGELVRAFDTAKKDLTVVLEATGTQTEKGFLLNASTYASPGDTIRVLCEGEVFTATALRAQVIPASGGATNP